MMNGIGFQHQNGPTRRNVWLAFRLLLRSRFMAGIFQPRPVQDAGKMWVPQLPFEAIAIGMITARNSAGLRM
jgi:hypothetical protein